MIPVEEQHHEDADSIWDYFSGKRKQSGSDPKVIYRGHADAGWELLPTILRAEIAEDLEALYGSPIMPEDQILAEFDMLRQFIYSCDAVGIAVPNDSVKFRDSNLSEDKFEEYRQNLSLWPNNELIEAMVMARLHALPTRLLDWTTDPYVALYFAVSNALKSWKNWRLDQRMSVHLLHISKSLSGYLGSVRILRVRGAISQNIVAQKGLFTVHPVFEETGKPVIVRSLEEYLPLGSSLIKLTVPVGECVRLYELCNQFNYNAASLYPNADGASESVIENLLYRRNQKAHKENPQNL